MVCGDAGMQVTLITGYAHMSWLTGIHDLMSKLPRNTCLPCAHPRHHHWNLLAASSTDVFIQGQAIKRNQPCN
jgi:hypothetical protein